MNNTVKTQSRAFRATAHWRRANGTYPNDERVAARQRRLDRVRELLRENPDLKNTDLVELLGVSRDVANSDLRIVKGATR